MQHVGQVENIATDAQGEISNRIDCGGANRAFVSRFERKDVDSIATDQAVITATADKSIIPGITEQDIAASAA